MNATRTLKFIVDGQTIKQDPRCDFTGLVPGTEGYLKAEFSFSPEWGDSLRIATFHSIMGREYPPQILHLGKTCMIPAEALKRKVFKVGVIAKSGPIKMTTNKVEVIQNGGNT